MPTTAEKLRNLRKTGPDNFEKIMRKYWDEVNAQELGTPLPETDTIAFGGWAGVKRRCSEKDDSMQAEKAAR